jgi:LacI family transcriptional regulator
VRRHELRGGEIGVVMTRDRLPRVRLRDVAERAGVSTTTVSFVLNERPGTGISVDTRDRVLRAAREMGYRPNAAARSLRTQVTNTIGLISDQIVTDNYGGDLVRGALVTALEHDHLLIVVESQDDPEVERRLVEDLLSRQVDGIILATITSDRIGLPGIRHGRTVLLNCTSSHALPAILADELAGGRDAANALLRAGHRRGIYLVGEVAEPVRPGRERRRGVAAALGEAGVELEGTIECTWWPESAYDAISTHLASGEVPRALICLNDRVAFGAYQALADAGLNIPGDVSVVSFDDSELARWLRPQLTSVALPYFDMGRIAVESVLGLSEEWAASQQQEQLVAMPLRERGSIAPPRRP